MRAALAAAAALLLLALCACASTKPPPPRASQGQHAHPPGPTAATIGPGSEPLATRLFTPSAFDVPKGFGAIALIAFARSPSSAAERGRYLMICKAFLANFPDSAEVALAAPARPQMVTIWPRKDLHAPLSVPTPSSPAEADAVCAAAVDNYDYLAADSWISRLPPEARFGALKRGPFLVAWAPPRRVGDPRAPLLRFDLSDFDQPQALDGAFRFWKTRIEADPSLWQDGWDLTRWRLQLAAWADHVAPQILSGLQIFNGLVSGGG
jgi:hypothetical protein